MPGVPFYGGGRQTREESVLVGPAASGPCLLVSIARTRSRHLSSDYKGPVHGNLSV
jgi:hypothetical protein